MLKRRNIKTVIIGDCYVGKTSILSKHINKRFSNDYQATLAISMVSKEIIRDEYINIIHFWDTAGSERFRSINSIFYRGADSCILVFDLTNYKSFSNISFWMDEFFVNTSPVRANSFPFILLGNKCDLLTDDNYIISERLISNFCKERNIKYFPVSAKNNIGLDEALDYIINKSIERKQELDEFQPEFEKISLTDKEDETKNKCFCF